MKLFMAVDESPDPEDLPISPSKGLVYIILSERNILSLLHKLGKEGSARTIVKEGEEWDLMVSVERDEEHYREGESPGFMTPDTEEFIRLYREERKGKEGDHEQSS